MDAATASRPGAASRVCGIPPPRGTASVIRRRVLKVTPPVMTECDHSGSRPTGGDCGSCGTGSGWLGTGPGPSGEGSVVIALVLALCATEVPDERREGLSGQARPACDQGTRSDMAHISCVHPRRARTDAARPWNSTSRSARNRLSLPRAGIDSHRAEPARRPDFFSGQDQGLLRPARSAGGTSREAIGVFGREPGNTGGCAGPGNGNHRVGNRDPQRRVHRRKRMSPARGSQDGGVGSRCPVHLWSGRAPEGSAHRT
ncbi:hypothetical protein GA0115254_120069 [Streptomyces sp. Ncost-T10-10d]|nr:hypothetical protein GA0115254_120069 [Streptomyces sp. Ncost-T10-10d]